MLNNKCVIQIVDKVATLSFDQIIASGVVRIWNNSQKDDKPFIEKTISNTNFEALVMNNPKGKFKFEIEINGETIVKTINN